MAAEETPPAKDVRRICQNDEELKQWITANTDLLIPDHAVCPHHDAPFEYIRTSYFEPGRDLIVWAPRGGGKTRLGALATLLDLLHKPGCSVRILGGSLDQSLRMWEHLLPDVQKLAEQELIDERGAARRIRLEDGSSAAVLTQSQRAVRGLRIQKLRCDEVEMFDPRIWEAAQLVTRSIDSEGWAGGVRGTVEAISTHHRPYGLMNRILERGREDGTKIIHWCLLDVLERCPPERDCHTCPLWDDCKEVAKTRCNGFFKIDDAIAMKRRVGAETWEAEMMCRRPNTQGCVFPRFDPTIHVQENVALRHGATLSLALDFGFHAPFVCLWVRDDGDVVHVEDEYVQPCRMMTDHLEVIRSRGRGNVLRVCCDPAGTQRSDQTAISNVQILKDQGYTVHTRSSEIVDGVELVRTALRSAVGDARLFIHPRCVRLIQAFRQYRYPEGGGELPLKDGEHDHPIDALRYFYVNRFRKAGGPRWKPY